MVRIAPTVLIAACLCLPVLGKTYRVDPAGSDQNPGTPLNPFRTLTRAVEALRPGDACLLNRGSYRESVLLELSGTFEKPIHIIGETDAEGRPLVVLDGTEPLGGDWEPVNVNGITAFAMNCTDAPQQVFMNDIPLTEARWPDQPFNKIWDRTTWAKGDKGGHKGKMISREISDTGIDWTGAMAVLNVGHQFKTWVRKVQDHAAGSDTFHYRLDERMGNDKHDGPTWWDDRFYLFGKMECLTSPGEWYFDEKSGRLLLIPPDGHAPQAGEVTIKVRDYGLQGSDLKHVLIQGIEFHACTFNFEDVENMVIENCDVLYPNYSRMLYDTQSPELKQEEVQTSVTGNSNLLNKIRIAYGNTAGIQLLGHGNVLQNSIIHDVCWAGNISHPGVLLNSSKGKDCSSRVSNCTIYNVGNVGIRYGRMNNIIEYNHVYNTGLACKDIAAIHTGSPDAYGSVARYNWVHDSMGKGIRGDDQTRGLTFHHNVVWNCDEGMILKGDFNKCYNNTVIGTAGHGCLIIPTRPEPQKWWAKADFLEVQNLNSIFCNNLVESIVYRHEPLPAGHLVSHNLELAESDNLESFMEAVNQRQFAEASRLIAERIRDKGKTIDGLNIPYNGARPDVGAYEVGGDIWVAGADWSPPATGIELDINAEIARSWELKIPGQKKSIPLPKILRESNLSPVSLNKLQSLFDDCWTAEEIEARHTAIQARNQFPEGSPDFNAQHEIVARLHQQANARLKERAGEVLAGSELTVFHTILK